MIVPDDVIQQPTMDRAQPSTLPAAASSPVWVIRPSTVLPGGYVQGHVSLDGNRLSITFTSATPLPDRRAESRKLLVDGAAATIDTSVANVTFGEAGRMSVGMARGEKASAAAAARLSVGAVQHEITSRLAVEELAMRRELERACSPILTRLAALLQLKAAVLSEPVALAATDTMMTAALQAIRRAKTPPTPEDDDTTDDHDTASADYSNTTTAALIATTPEVTSP